MLRGRGIVTTERRGTTVIYAVADPDLFALLDVARRIRNRHLATTVDLLRLIEGELLGAGRR